MGTATQDLTECLEAFLHSPWQFLGKYCIRFQAWVAFLRLFDYFQSQEPLSGHNLPAPGIASQPASGKPGSVGQLGEVCAAAQSNGNQLELRAH